MKDDPEAAARFREQMEKWRNDPEAQERFRRMRPGDGAPGRGRPPREGSSTQGTQ